MLLVNNNTALCIKKYLKMATSGSECLKYLKILQLVKKGTARYDIFELKRHSIETSVRLDNINFLLLALVVETYFHLRQHHFVNLRNLDLNKVNITQNATKNIIYRTVLYVYHFYIAVV